ncbi:MAG TPA: glycosyltransferase [Acidimicrobiales bacterium]|nr:glycosyltransferase [Acidimicrobiales bacterium]
MTRAHTNVTGAARGVARSLLASLDRWAPGAAGRVRAAMGRVPDDVAPGAQAGASVSVGRSKAVRPGEWLDRSWDFDPAEGDLPWMHRFPFVVDPSLRDRPALNVLIPGLRAGDLSGGPNTAIQLACRLAMRGQAVRFVSTDVELDDADALRRHMEQLVGGAPDVEVTTAQGSRALSIGENDVFLATAWWTAQVARRLMAKTRAMRFLYLIQDYEPLFFPASTTSALAEETYSLDHIPIVNSRLLLDHLRAAGVGRFADPEFSAQAIVLEPAVDVAQFRPRERTGEVRRLLLYARPSNGQRNLFELAVAALRLAARRGAFDGAHWDLVGIGEPFPDQVVGDRLVLRPHPWMTVDEYAALMGSSDMLVSLMLSPHPSYPPLEMAASGGLVVTNSYGVKTTGRLQELAPAMRVAEPTVEGVADTIAAVTREVSLGSRPAPDLSLPKSWDDALAPVLPRAEAAINDLRRAPDRLDEAWRAVPRSDYDSHRLARMADRRALYQGPVARGMFSLLTPAWNTDAGYLRVLARSVLEQGDAGDFEWVLTDNGSDRPDTIALLDELARHPAVRFERLATNKGIIAGMRNCLERASNDYAVALDHDDLLAPDALRVVGDTLEENGLPALFYTDEDCIDLDIFRRPNHKPGWDPVLFGNSCYVAHLSGIRRELALELGAYTDESADASPDWDLFSRAVVAGHAPLHIPEILYSWRVHAESTASGHEAKSNVASSQERAVTRLLAAVPNAADFTLERNPRSPGANDWWTRRRRAGSNDLPTVAIRPELEPEQLAKQIAAIAGHSRLVHLQADGVQPVDDEWRWECLGLVERFPDTAVVGGRIINDHVVIGAAGYFGFGRGWDGPEVGQDTDDFGHLDLTAKQHSVDVVPADHCVADPALVIAAAEVLALRGQPLTLLAPWLGVLARRRGLRCVVSPHVLADGAPTLDYWVTAAQRHSFLVEHSDLLGTTPTLSSRLDLRAGRAFAPVDDVTRANHVAELLSGEGEGDGGPVE